jgi:predicted NBD/HSP70 family sugar kinase
VGFGTTSTLYTVINAFDPREIIVIGFVEIGPDTDLRSILRIDVKERLEHPLDDVIEPDIGREFGLLVSEDDFSATGALAYKPASVAGEEIDLGEIHQLLDQAKDFVIEAAVARDRDKK